MTWATPADRQEEYHQYLASDLWQKRRVQVFARANGTCEVCEKRPATQVHHLTYERVFDERLEDLQAICRRCHQKEHGLSRTDRPLTKKQKQRRKKKERAKAKNRRLSPVALATFERQVRDRSR